jgi:PAS domain S-box-containing protein
MPGHEMLSHPSGARAPWAAAGQAGFDERQFLALLDNLPLIVWMHDENGEQTFVNQTFCHYFGVRRAEMRAQRWKMLMHPDDARAYAEAFQAAVAERREFRGEVRVRDHAGEWRWLESWARPVLDDGGRYRGHLGTSADITDRKTVETERDILTRELSHRIKNVHAVVQSVARQTVRHSGPDFLEQFEQRIHALARAQDHLVTAGANGIDLERLIRTQLGHCGDLLGSRITLDGPSLPLAGAAAEPLAMAFHELSTNAAKYGAISDPRGTVAIRWSCDGDTVTLEWTERGGPPVAAPLRVGFGSKIIGPVLEQRLDGAVAVEFAAEGLSWRLTCPRGALIAG